MSDYKMINLLAINHDVYREKEVENKLRIEISVKISIFTMPFYGKFQPFTNINLRFIFVQFQMFES